MAHWDALNQLYTLNEQAGGQNNTYYGAKATFLEDFSEIWYYTTIWATATVGLVFFFAGCWGSKLSQVKRRFMWLPIVSLITGSLFGFVQAALISVLISAICVSVPYTLGIDTVAAIGISIGLVFLYFHLGRADFIHT